MAQCISPSSLLPSPLLAVEFPEFPSSSSLLLSAYPYAMAGAHEAGKLSMDVSSVIDSLKKRFSADRCVQIKMRKCPAGGDNNIVDLLTRRQEDALNMLNGLELNNGERDNSSSQEDNLQSSTTVLLGTSSCTIGMEDHANNAMNLEASTMFHALACKKTHNEIFDKNQRMTEDQSVVGRRRIYYDQTGGEALICSDSEEEIIEEEEDKKEFVDCEDYILRLTIEEIGLSDTVLDSLGEYFSRKPCEIKARYEFLSREKTQRCIKKGSFEADVQIGDAFIDKDLDAALDSFDNLYLIVDCMDALKILFSQQRNNFPGAIRMRKRVYRVASIAIALKSESVTAVSSTVPDDFERKLVISSSGGGGQISPRKKTTGSTVGRRSKSHQSESASSNARVMSESSESEIRPRQETNSIQHSSSPSKVKIAGKSGVHKRNNKRAAEKVLGCIRKRQKKMAASDSDSMSGSVWPRDMKLRSNSGKGSKDASSSERKVLKSPIARRSRRKELQIQDNHSSAFVEALNEVNEVTKDLPVTIYEETSRKEEVVDENVCKNDHNCEKPWKAIEKGLFAKGLEIFGRNRSAWIARWDRGGDTKSAYDDHDTSPRRMQDESEDGSWGGAKARSWDDSECGIVDASCMMDVVRIEDVDHIDNARCRSDIDALGPCRANTVKLVPSELGA
ncbi:hypothetical protein ACLOJK_035447 [Asimina triloba]